nr:tyrosine-type recombinase/integrase [Oharaeibacter diazotrophicus]
MRCYHRATGTPVDLVKAPLGTAEFFAACATIAATLAVAPDPKPGTLGMLVSLYRAHDAFAALAPRTRADYQRIFDYLKPIADTPLSRFDAPTVARIRDKAGQRGHRHGNYVRQVLSIVFAWGAERGHVAGNPAALVKGLKRPKDRPDANRPWTDAELHAVLAAAHPHLRAVLALMAYTGLGPKDAVKLPRSALKEGRIATRRSKTGEAVYWPCPSPLLAELAAMPAHDAVTLCASSRGRPWSQDGVQVAFQRIKKELEPVGAIGPGLTLYGLRHTVAVILRECGFDERTIADALGQKTIEMARHYAKGADLTRKMAGVVESFDAELNRRRAKPVKPD